MINYISKFRTYARTYGFKQALKKSCEKLGAACRIIPGYPPALFSNSPLEKIGSLIYRCNICGQVCETKISDLEREKLSCRTCGSTVRMRAIIHVLSMELFGKSLAIDDFPVKPDISGIGMSDWEGYAVPLSQKLGYKNTYYHQEPQMDITSLDPSLEGTMDFVISSDVFEHVSPPVSIAFENVRKLLKSEGVLIFSVPYLKEGEAREHFPELYKYEIIEQSGRHFLKNITREGIEQVYENLNFHGGIGTTLEMRYFSESSLMEEIRNAGFDYVRVYGDPCFEHGVVWKNDWSLPIAARIK